MKNHLLVVFAALLSACATRITTATSPDPFAANAILSSHTHTHYHSLHTMSNQSANLPAAQVESAPATKQHSLPQAAVFNPAAEMPNTSILKDGVPGNISIAICYHEFQQGVETRGIYMGLVDYTFFSKYSNQMECRPAAVFVNEKGQIRLNAAVLFVGALKKCAEKTAFLAVMTGLVKKGDKNLQDFDVFLLN